MHSKIDCPDGSRDAVLMACAKNDQKISRVETGATLLQKWGSFMPLKEIE